MPGLCCTVLIKNQTNYLADTLTLCIVVKLTLDRNISIADFLF